MDILQYFQSGIICWSVFGVLLIVFSAIDNLGYGLSHRLVASLARKHFLQIHGLPADSIKITDSNFTKMVKNLNLDEQTSKWIARVNTIASSSLSREQDENFYANLKRSFPESRGHGEVLSLGDAYHAEIELQIFSYLEEFNSGSSTKEEFLQRLSRVTTYRHRSRWFMFLRRATDDERPKFWSFIGPSAIPFLDYVGRGTALGLFLGILLNDMTFSIDKNGIISLTTIIGGLLGAGVHGSITWVRIFSWNRTSILPGFLAKTEPWITYFFLSAVIIWFPSYFRNI